MKASWAFFLIFLMMFYCVVNTQPVKAAEDSWATMAEMPTARSGLGVAVVNGKIYAIGGYSSSYLATNEEYDPATNTWSTKKPMPNPRCDFGIAVYQNKIYVIGGDGLGGKTGVNEVYDPLTDTWETKTSMPTKRAQLCANVVNGKIYLIGGRTGEAYSTVSLNEVYDPSTDTWTTKEPIPYPVVDYVSAVVDNRIYVISGQDEFGAEINLVLNQIYDPETDTWSYGASIPTAVFGAAVGVTTGVVAPKRIYVMGGIDSFLSTDLNQVYDPEGNVWTTGARMPTPRSSLGVAVVNDVLYAIGGCQWLDKLYAKNEQYTPIGYAAVNGPIIIRSDGSVVGTDKIQRDGNFYTFTGDISDSLVVERDNIVVDGAGYSIEGPHTDLAHSLEGIGILVDRRSYVTISNLTIQNFLYGICLNSSACMHACINNCITKCNITNNSKGIYVENSSDNIIRESQITNNTDIGIYLFESPDTTIVDNLIGDNANDGISLLLSSDNNVNYCDIRDNGVGIRIMNSSITPLVDSNITNNSIGIHLEASSVVIQFNNIANNGIGIQLAGSDNRIDHNNFINNTKQVYDIAWDNPEMSPSVNTWYEGDTGNYWSDYNGTGDTPYVIDENNQDNFPASKPFRIPLDPRLPETPIFLITNWIFWGMIIAAIVGATLLVYFKKVKKTTGEAEIMSEGVK